MPNVNGTTTSRLEAQGHVKTIIRVVEPAPLAPTTTAHEEVSVKVEAVVPVPPSPCCNARCAFVWALRGLLVSLTITGMVVVGYYLVTNPGDD